MPDLRTLIVENEVLIADLLQRYLNAMGHEVVGKATSYNEAIEIYKREEPELTLIDIRLNSDQSGVELAYFIQQYNYSSPFIYLSSQIDHWNLGRVKRTFPAGYLTKPIQKKSLYAVIDRVVGSKSGKPSNLTDLQYHFYDGKIHQRIEVNDILFLEAQHEYVKLYLQTGKLLMHRITLGELLNRLPASHFLQTHRSFAVNVNCGFELLDKKLCLGYHKIPVSQLHQRAVFNIFRA